MSGKKLKYIMFLILSHSILASSQDIQFVELENLPEARSSLTSANNGDAIFIVNGFGVNEQYTDEIFKYDISLDMWSLLTSMTISKRYASAEIIGDFLYVFNGVTEGSNLNSAVEKINIITGSVEYLSDHPQPSRAAGVTKWGNKIYTFGGTLEANEYSNKLYEFDLQNDTWTELTEIPFAGETKGEIIDGKLYIIGGYNGSVSNRIDVYDLSTGVWGAGFEMPVGISAHATALVGSKIYLVGDFANLTSVAYFDTFASDFQVLTNNLNERRHCAAEGVEGSLFAIGGNTASNVQSSITSVQKADITTSISEVSNAEIIRAYPNPTASTLHLNMKFERLYLYDIDGKGIQKFTNVIDLDVNNLTEGTYFLKGMVGEKIYKAKFIKI